MNHNHIYHFVSLQFDHSKKEPLYRQLYEKLLEAILSHNLSPGYPLPPVRKLAASLHINIGTVLSAYRELERNGYILTRRGSGSFVSGGAGLSSPPVSFDFSSPSDPGLYDMAHLTLDPAVFSAATLRSVVNRIIERDGSLAFSYTESQGYKPLRESVCRSLETHGILSSPCDIQVVSGSQQGIDVAARALVHPGDFVVMENPTYPGAAAAMRSCGARIIDIPTDRSGISMEALEKVLLKFHPRLFYATPNIQNPTGITYSQDRRISLLGLAKRYRFYILEDDYMGGLYNGNSAPPTLKSLDTHDRIIYLRSISSLFFPGFRLAFLIMPPCLAPSLKSIKQITDIATSGLTQRIFDWYLREGLWSSHLSSLRQACRMRLDFALDAAENYLPQSTSFIKPAGGLSLWITLPEGCSAEALSASARQKGFLFTPGSSFYIRQPSDSHLRISFSSVSLPVMEEGFRLLGTLCRALDRTQRPASI